MQLGIELIRCRIMADSNEGRKDISLVIPYPVKYVEATAFMVIAYVEHWIRAEVLFIVLNAADIAAV